MEDQKNHCPKEGNQNGISIYIRIEFGDDVMQTHARQSMKPIFLTILAVVTGMIPALTAAQNQTDHKIRRMSASELMQFEIAAPASIVDDRRTGATTLGVLDLDTIPSPGIKIGVTTRHTWPFRTSCIPRFGSQ